MQLTNQNFVDMVKKTILSIVIVLVAMVSTFGQDTVPNKKISNPVQDSVCDSIYTFNSYQAEDTIDLDLYFDNVKYEYNWPNIAIGINHILKENGMVEWGTDRYLCIMAMINPLESLHCEKGDTLYLRLSYDGTFFINAWNSDISKGVSYNTFWEKNKPLKLEENIWTNSYPIQYNGLDKLILNWDVVGLIEESKFVNKHFSSNHSPSTISLFRIILKEKSSYTVDFVRYLNYMPLTEEIIEDYKQEFEPFPEIPSQYIH